MGVGPGEVLTGMANPLVSICVPTYNRAAWLRDGLKSICGQDYSPLEILISDNGSDDETEEVGREAARSDPRVRYVRHPENLGVYGNHNFCIEESRGELLSSFHDHDERTSSASTPRSSGSIPRWGWCARTGS